MGTYIQPEHEAQKIVCQWLDLHKILYCHVPNERVGDVQRKILAGLGVKAGVPDLLIFTLPRPCPANGWMWPTYHGVAIEMKRSKGGKATHMQSKWLRCLSQCGWMTRVCHGSNEAIDWLEELGYGGTPG